MKERVEKVKEHIRRNKGVYITVGASALVAGFTCLVMRSVASQHIDRGNAVVAKRGIAVLADRSVVTNNVSLISSRRQGAPSWVIRCIETGNIFTSQLSAAKEMGLNASEISQHLNGRKEHAQGYHFERICMAA